MLKFNFLYFNIFERRKLCRYSIGMFIILVIFCMTIYGLKSGIQNKYVSLQQENIDHNYILITYNEKNSKLENDVKNMPHINKFYLFFKYQNLVYSDNSLIKLLNGKYPEKYDEVIVSDQIKKQINDTIYIKIDGYTCEFKIVGIYDSKKDNFTIDNFVKNPIYVSSEFYNNNIQKSELTGIILKLDNYRNIVNISESISNSGDFDLTVKDSNREILDRYFNFYNGINLLSQFLMLICTIFVLIIELIIVYDNRSNIAILKSLGFSTRKISFLMTFYLILLLFCSVLPSIIISKFISVILQQFIVFDFKFLINIILICILMSIILSLALHSIINKINIVSIIKKEK